MGGIEEALAAFGQMQNKNAVFAMNEDEQEVPVSSGSEMDALFAELETAIRENSSLEGKSVVVTGKLWNFSRREVEAAIRSKGGSCQGGVRKDTAFLVVGERPGAVKIRAAMQRDLPMLTEDQLMAMFDASDL